MEFSLATLFSSGGWVMWPLALFSVLTWAVVLERTYVYLTLRPKVQEVSESLAQTLKTGDLNAARQICHNQKPFLSDLFLCTLDHRKSRQEAEKIVERNRLRLGTYFRKHLWVLGTIGSASPFVGLLGTVVGIIRAFSDMATKGSGGFGVVAGGISEALIATGAGLVVAIISLLTYNIFVNSANQTLSSLKLTLEEIMDESFRSTSPT